VAEGYVPSKRVEILKELSQPQLAVKVLVRVANGWLGHDVDPDSNQ
jgi:hypothetical protein